MSEQEKQVEKPEETKQSETHKKPRKLLVEVLDLRPCGVTVEPGEGSDRWFHPI
jgi:hypothetical protein